MMLPIIQYQKDVSGIAVFESISKRLIFTVPKSIYSDLEETDLGADKVILQGRISFELSEDELNVVQTEYENAQLLPVPPTLFKRDKVGWLEGLSEHSVTIQEFSHVPYPEFLMSVTLNVSEPNYDEIRERLLDEWSRSKLLDGLVSLEFDAALLGGRGTITFDHRAVRDRLESELPRKGITRTEVAGFCKATLGQEMLLMIDGLGVNSRFGAYLADVGIRHLEGVHFSEGFETVQFHDGESSQLFDVLESIGTDFEETFEKLLLVDFAAKIQLS